jgi:dipeptidyl aminopeptidase/acylaminoacyl peptidase
MAFVNRGSRIVGIDKNDVTALGMWDSLTGERVATVTAGRGEVQVVAADATGRRLAWATAVGDASAEVHWRDLESHAEPPPLRIPTRGVTALAIDPSGGRLAVIGAADQPGARSLWLCDVAAATPPVLVTTGTGMFGGLAFSPDGRLLALADDGMVRIHRTDRAELAFQVPIPSSTTCLTFSPDGRRLAAVGYDGTTTLVDPACGKRVFQLPSLTGGRPDEMACDARVAFSPDGSWLISTNWDGSINVWDGSPTGD